MMTREDVTKLYDALCAVGQSAAAVAFLTHDQAQRAVIVEKEEKLLVLERTIPVMNQMIEQQRLQTESDRHAYSLLNERCEQQAKRIQELEERLCIDYCYVHNPNDPTNPTKQTLTEDQKKTFPDKIYCLEADVQLRDEKIEQQAKELERLQEVTTAWRNIQQEEMCYVMREIEALGIDINKSVISDGKALWDVCMDRIAELRKAEQENKTLREVLQDCLPILKEDIEACGPCDHGVNHCICGLKSLAEQVQHALNNVKAPAERGKETQVLREALQLLYDCQNGCPLPKYEADWNLAMQLAQQALQEVSG